MRICFVTIEYATHPPFGGIATQVRMMARWMACHGHDTHVICLSRDRKPGTEGDDGVQVHFVSPQRIKPRRLIAYASKLPGLGELKEAYYGWDLVEDSLGAWLKVRDLERQRPFDIVQCTDFRGLGFFGVWPFTRSKPLFLRAFGLVSQYSQVGGWQGTRFQHSLERICAQRMHFILAVTYWLADLYQSQFDSPENRLGVLYQPIEVPEFVLGTQREQYQSEIPVILFVGRIQYGKGCDILYRALEQAKRAVPLLTAAFIGEPSTELDALQFDAFRQANVDWVIHYGQLPQTEVFHRMLTSTILVLPSRTESAGNVLAEAQFCSLPQVASRVGGIPEYVHDGSTGLLVAPEDPEALADAIVRLCLNPELRAFMGRRSQELAHARFGLDTAMKQFVRVCEALMEGRSPVTVLKMESPSFRSAC